MKKVVLIILSSFLFLCGCNVFNREKENGSDRSTNYYEVPTKEEMSEMENNLLTDPQVINSDKLLYVGDKGLDKKFKQVQNPATEYENQMILNLGTKDSNLGITKVHHNWKYPSLHLTFINPNVKAINGSYVNNVIGKGWEYYGTPYQLGSNRNDPTTFDCSDFTRWIHLWTTGMDLPKTSSSQYEYVKKFSKRKYTDLSQAKRGDLLFFMSYKGWQKSDYNGINVKAQPIAHCGIYIGDGKILHTASQKTGGVRFDKIKGSHLEYRFVGGGQVIQ